ncbi:MAG: NAD-dependent epimerase/dehydratase family protein [Dehalococcoidales bacterium]|nr:NAD-dependent epimerase/dehydratase family protein [Dehalococcoidales bacterium]
MKTLVTGATGFIGSNLVFELLKQGYEVKALVRKGSDRRNIQGLNIEIISGDLKDKASLIRALDGCDTLFHAAAAYTFWARDPGFIYETNVQGTGNILTAALAKGIKKVVYTSSESTIGINKNGNILTEEVEASPRNFTGHYHRSKYLAERLALDMANKGLPIVIVNPTVPVGPRDIKPTPTGQFIVDFLNRRLPAYVECGLNVVDVGDVAKGHILALERGRIGQKYILGNRNLTFREILAILESITGIKAPGLKIPTWLALAAAHINEAVSDILGKHPRVPVAGVKTACRLRYFDGSKAVAELGLPQTAVEEAFSKAVSWFKENGYVRN